MRLLVTDAAAQPPRQATAWLIMTLGRRSMKYPVLFVFLYLTGVCFGGEAYLVADGRAVRVDIASESKIEGLRPITVTGAVDRPGIYLFSGRVPLVTVLALAGPRKEGFAADLTKVRLFTATQGIIEGPVTINVKRLMESGRKEELWILSGTEIIAVPETLE